MARDRDMLKKQYKDIIALGLDKDQLLTKTMHFLQKSGTNDCFKLLAFLDILKDFLAKARKKQRRAELQHFGKVFQVFEKYAIRIMAKPWCKDFYTIKLFTGFYKYNIERWVSWNSANSIFTLMGYEKTSRDSLKLTVPVDEERALAIGFELYLAHTLLYVLNGSEYLNCYSMEDIMDGWRNTTGDTVMILEWLEKNEFAKEEDMQWYASSADNPDKTARIKSITTKETLSHYDKNGQKIDNLIRYPPSGALGGVINPDWCSEMIERGSGAYSSLNTVNIPDNQLYGDGDESQESSPVRQDDDGEYVSLRNARGDSANAGGNGTSDHLEHNIQMSGEDSSNLYSNLNEVLRGDDSHIYQNIKCISSGTGHIIVEGSGSKYERHSIPDEEVLGKTEKYFHLLENRIKKEEQGFHTIANEKSAEQAQCCNKSNCIIESRSQHCRPPPAQTPPAQTSRDIPEFGEGDVKWNVNGNHHRPMVSSTVSEFGNEPSGLMDPTCCDVCGRPPAFFCTTCSVTVCETCSDILEKRRCQEAGHVIHRISNV